MRKFFISTEEEISEGKTTDIYFVRTVEILEKKGIRKKVAMEVRTKSFPEGRRWGVLVGIQEVVNLLERKKVDVWGLPEGEIFYPGEPVLTIEGIYQDFGIYETPILGFICQSTGVATRCSHLRIAAWGKTLLSFGARRMHPAVSPLIDRACYITGIDGISCVLSADMLGVKPQGTMPHALILIVGSTEKAAQLFDEIIDRNVKRIVLVDTLGDEKFETINAASTLGERLFGVRLDTPSSRKGNMIDFLKEIRWELDLRGFKEVKIFLSGGIDEDTVKELYNYVDGFGVGTYLSNSPVVDFAADIVEIEGKPMSKRGKESGKKKTLRCPACLKGEVTPWIESIDMNCPRCGSKMECITIPLIKNGELVYKIPDYNTLRESVIKKLKILAN